ARHEDGGLVRGDRAVLRRRPLARVGAGAAVHPLGPPSRAAHAARPRVGTAALFDVRADRRHGRPRARRGEGDLSLRVGRGAARGRAIRRRRRAEAAGPGRAVADGAGGRGVTRRQRPRSASVAFTSAGVAVTRTFVAVSESSTWTRARPLLSSFIPRERRLT